MTTRTKLELIGGAVVLAVLGLLGYLWLKAHDRAIAADVKVAMLQQQRAAISIETQQKVAEVQQERKQAVTPTQQIQYVERYVPVHLNLPTFDMTALPPDAPDAPSALISNRDLPKLTDYVAQCEVCKVERTGCQKELGLCDQQVKELQAGRKSGFWGKVKDVGLGLGIGFAAGYVAHR